jgi:hypothetical protein
VAAGSLSGGDLVFVCQAAEDLFSADLVLDEVDLRREQFARFVKQTAVALRPLSRALRL